jgi:hypothetical protein
VRVQLCLTQLVPERVGHKVGDDVLRGRIVARERMAFMFLTIIVLVSLNVAASQAPVMVSDVARLVRTVMDGGTSYPVFEYEGLAVRGHLTVREYRDGIALVKPLLQPGERMIELTASAGALGSSLWERSHGEDVR